METGRIGGGKAFKTAGEVRCTALGGGDSEFPITSGFESAVGMKSDERVLLASDSSPVSKRLS